MLFAFSIACRQHFKALHKASRTKFTTSSLISRLRKLRILARRLCLLFVRFLLLGPIAVPFSAPNEPSFYPDPRTHPSLLQNLTKRTPVPGSQPPEDPAVPLLDMALQWFSDFSECDNPVREVCRLSLPRLCPPGAHDSVYLGMTPKGADAGTRRFCEKHCFDTCRFYPPAHSENASAAHTSVLPLLEFCVFSAAMI